MILRAMYTGVSGIRAEGEALGVVGDNIANVNTVGFKRERANFEDVLGHSVLAGTGSALPGSGVRLADVQQLFSQGSLTNTGVSTDLALNGDGFFVVSGNVDGISANFYTRAGQFVIDKDGYLTNPGGLKLQAYAAQDDGTFAAAPSSIRAPTAAISPQPTAQMGLVANLDSTEAAITAAWDPQNPGGTASYQTSMTVFDSLGDSHSLEVYFRKTAANTWDYHVLASGGEVTGGTAGTNQEIGTGSLTFTSNGALNTTTVGTAIVVDFNGATAGQAIDVDFGTSIGAGGTGLDGITQFAAKSNVSSQEQDGFAAGEFSGIAVDGQGVVTGLYTNGEKLPIGQLTIAKFRSNDGLGRAGQNLWIETRDSGTPAMGTAGAGGRGAVSAGTLESSNVDLAEEFVNLIQHQRSFSANSKTVTTADEMLQELINIKR